MFNNIALTALNQLAPNALKKLCAYRSQKAELKMQVFQHRVVELGERNSQVAQVEHSERKEREWEARV